MNIRVTKKPRIDHASALVARLLMSAISQEITRLRVRYSGLRFVVDLPDGTSCGLRTFINRVPVCGDGGLPWAWPRSIHNRIVKMAGLSQAFRSGQSPHQWEIAIAAQPCNYSVTVDVVGTNTYEVELAAVPGTERKTAAERQAFAMKVLAQMEGEHAGGG